MAVVHGLEVVEHHPPLGVVIVHFDFLADDALLLADSLLCKVGGLYKVQQNLQGLVHLVRGGEQVAGGLEGGEGVGAGPCFGEALEGVPLLAFKELVLQVVGNALGHGFGASLVAALEAVVDGAVPGAENGVGGAAMLLGVEQHRQARGVLHLVVAVPHLLAGDCLSHAGRLLSRCTLPPGEAGPRPPPPVPGCRRVSAGQPPPGRGRSR